MSYIRGITNPESLYIYGDGRTTHWHWNVREPLSNGSEMTVPPAVLHALARRWYEHGGCCELSHRGLKVAERHVYLKTGTLVRAKDKAWMRSPLTMPTAFLVRIEYRGTFVHVWPVTWEYVVRGIVARLREAECAKQRSRSRSRIRKGAR